MLEKTLLKSKSTLLTLISFPREWWEGFWSSADEKILLNGKIACFALLKDHVPFSGAEDKRRGPRGNRSRDVPKRPIIWDRSLDASHDPSERCPFVGMG